MPVRHVDTMKNEIGESEDVRDGLQLPARDGLLQCCLIVEGIDLLFADEINGGA
jgi:hypothetical protein